MVMITQAALEPSLNNYSGFAVLDQVFKYAVGKGKRFAVAVYPTNFWHDEPSGYVPAYILADPATYGPGFDSVRGGWGQMSSNVAIGAYWRTAYLNRVKAMFAALAARTSPNSTAWTYDTDPNFEAVTWTESSANSTGDSTLTQSVFISAWNSLTASMIASWPHTNVLSQINWLYASSGPDPNVIRIVNNDAAAGAALSGPDTSTLAKMSAAQVVFMGGISGATDWRGRAPYDAQVEYPDYSQATLAQMFQTATTLKASRIWWANGYGNLPAIQTFIAANPISAGACPSNYVNNRHGCNTK
jgi:hypothetical protein